MSLQKLMPWLVAALLLSAATMWWAAGQNARGMSTAAASLFVALVMGVGIWINGQALKKPTREAQAQFHMLRRNTRLTALVYAWGAASMLAVYMLTDLKWRHGWQYGSAMALIAGGLLGYVHALGKPNTLLASPSRLAHVGTLTIAHGLAAVGGLAFLVGSGKLATIKSDWAANDIFLAGGVAVAVLALVTALTHRRLNGRDGSDHA